MPNKHVPKHRAPKKEPFGRRRPAASSRKGYGSSIHSVEPGVTSVSLTEGDGADPAPTPSPVPQKPSSTDLGIGDPAAPAPKQPFAERLIAKPGVAPKPTAARPNAQPPAAAKAPVAAAKVAATPSSDGLFAPETAPQVSVAGPAPAEPTEALERPAPRRQAGGPPAESHRDNGSSTLQDLQTLQVKSAIRSGDQAWDPFLKDPEPDSRRFRRNGAVSDLDKLISSKARRKPARRTTTDERQQHQTLGQWFKEILLLGLIAVLTAVLLTNYVVQAFFIPSESMEDTLMTDDRVLVNKLVYRLREPRPGDIVVFTSPEMDAADIGESGPIAKVLNQAAQGLGLRSSVQDLIKRVIAVEGQTVEVKIGSVFVDGKQVDEPFRKDLLPMPDYGPFKVPAGKVFVMGDNRGQSHDSRAFGPVDTSTIVGRAFALIWPLQRFAWLNS